MDDPTRARFDPLWNDIDSNDEFYVKKPLLAHYTSIANIEKILQSTELWFANPLYMNDREEVAFGIREATAAVNRSMDVARACGTHERRLALLDAWDQCNRKFANEHVLDTFVFCLSEHEKEDADGLLSMWRGYGGNGSGVAIVFDTAQMSNATTSAMILARVHYGTATQRRAWLDAKMKQFAQLLTLLILPTEQLSIAAQALFERILLFALFSKHNGFEEEREWRVVYMPSRDLAGVLKPFFSYSIGQRGVEPRLKFKIAPLDGVTSPDLTLERITSRIILGPTVSSPLAVHAFHRLLESTNHPTLKDRVHASEIPFRERP